MSRMRLDPDTIQHENIEIAKPVHRFLRNYLEVSRVSKIVEPISDHRQLTMDDLERRHGQVVANHKGSVRRDGVRYQLRQAAPKMCGLEDVLKNSAEILQCNLICIDAHRSV